MLAMSEFSNAKMFSGDISSARIRRVRIAVCDSFLPSCESIFKMVRSMRIIL